MLSPCVKALMMCADSHFLPSNSSDFNLTVVAPGDAGENAYGVCDFRCYNRLNESTLPASELCTLPVRCTYLPWQVAESHLG